MSGGLHSWIHTAHLVALTVMFVATNLVIGRELPTASSAPDTSSFYRGVNLNGPPVVIDGNQWEGHEAKWLQCNDRAFENQLVPLDPPTDPERTKMIRSSRWGGNEVTINDIPP
ncbi:hypothetical protein, partial [Schlesneria sp.]